MVYNGRERKYGTRLLSTVSVQWGSALTYVSNVSKTPGAQGNCTAMRG